MISIAAQFKRFAVVAMLACLVASLAAPMLASAHEDKVFVSIRVYHGLESEDPDGLYRRTAEEFMEIIRETEGFIGYYWLHAGENVVAINLFESEEQAMASTEAASSYITENLAAVVPFPPLVVEGVVDIGFVEALDGMEGSDVSSLHASVRIYDGFEAEDQDEFVAIVEDGFLPIMRGADGFFGYYLLHDGDETLGAVSIFDSEASALASNEAAADFVAENLTAYLPSSPVIVNGRVGIAALSALEAGANLIDHSVFASVRVYDGVDPMDQDEIARLTAEGFLPLMRASEGFVGYYLLPADDRLASVTLFDSAEQASASSDAARGFVAENLAPLLPNAPLIIEGKAEVTYVLDAVELMTDEGMTSLHALLAIYDDFDMARLDETAELIESVFLPDLRATGGLVSYYGISDGVDTTASLRIMDSEQSLQQGSDIAADFVAEYLADWLPAATTTVSGRLGLGTLADSQMSANLADYGRDEVSVFASVRVYDGVDPADQDEIARRTDEGFLPIMHASDGFVGYYLLSADDRLAAVSLF